MARNEAAGSPHHPPCSRRALSPVRRCAPYRRCGEGVLCLEAKKRTTKTKNCDLNPLAKTRVPVGSATGSSGVDVTAEKCPGALSQRSLLVLRRPRSTLGRRLVTRDLHSSIRTITHGNFALEKRTVRRLFFSLPLTGVRVQSNLLRHVCWCRKSLRHPMTNCLVSECAP